MNKTAVKKITIETEIIKETSKAVLIKLKNTEIWLPKSQITIEDAHVTLPEWLYNKKVATADSAEKTVCGTICKETDKAVCLLIDDYFQVWLPKSNIEIKEENGNVTVTMPNWLYQTAEHKSSYGTVSLDMIVENMANPSVLARY